MAQVLVTGGTGYIASWDAAVAGCEYVLHVASPLGTDSPKDPNELIVPARDGTLRVLRAAIRAGVKRVVMTSSVAASSRRIDGPLGAIRAALDVGQDARQSSTRAHCRRRA